MPEASLLFNDGIEGADAREDEQESTHNESRIVKTFGFGQLDHGRRGRLGGGSDG